MIRFLKKPTFWALLAAVVWWLWRAGELRHAPGVRLDREPEQQTITAVAAYSIEARVLHTKRYWVDGDYPVPVDPSVDKFTMERRAHRANLLAAQDEQPVLFDRL